MRYQGGKRRIIPNFNLFQKAFAEVEHTLVVEVVKHLPSEMEYLEPWSARGAKWSIPYLASAGKIGLGQDSREDSVGTEPREVEHVDMVFFWLRVDRLYSCDRSIISLLRRIVDLDMTLATA